MIRTLLVDDEPPARAGLRVRLAGESDIEIVGEAPDGPAAVEAIRSLRPDLVFLDIQMPGMDGFDVLAQAGRDCLPVVVFVTAYDRYAIRAFDVHALDYLLKPYTAERLNESLERARRELAREDGSAPAAMAEMLDARERAAGASTRARWAVKDGGRYVLLKSDEVDWIEAAANYIRFHARGRTFLLRGTLSGLERTLDPARFARIHRSTIVNVERVKEIRPEWHGDFEVLLADGKVLRMSRNYRGGLLR